MGREKGIVKWFSTEKGYGFVRRETGEEIFVHHTDIEVDGYASLRNGESVEFEVFESDRGPKARKLVPLEAGAENPAGGKKPKNDQATAARRSKGRGGNRSDGEKRALLKPLAEQLRARLGKRFPGLGS
jgi:CspA family cold shock protein